MSTILRDKSIQERVLEQAIPYITSTSNERAGWLDAKAGEHLSDMLQNKTEVQNNCRIKGERYDHDCKQADKQLESTKDDLKDAIEDEKEKQREANELERKFVKVKIERERVAACLEYARKRVNSFEDEVETYQVEAGKAQAERQRFFESRDEMNYFAGGGTLRGDHDCYLANIDVISLCKKLGVDPGVIDGMKRYQLRNFHMFLKNGGFDHNTAMGGDTVKVGRQKKRCGWIEILPEEQERIKSYLALSALAGEDDFRSPRKMASINHLRSTTPANRKRAVDSLYPSPRTPGSSKKRYCPASASHGSLKKKADTMHAPVYVDGIDNSRLSLACQSSLEWSGLLSQDSTDSSIREAIYLVSKKRGAGEE